MSTPDRTPPIARTQPESGPLPTPYTHWRCAAALAALQTAALLLLGLPFILVGEVLDALFLGDIDGGGKLNGC